jgi:anti-anti-sigma factor
MTEGNRTPSSCVFLDETVVAGRDAPGGAVVPKTLSRDRLPAARTPADDAFTLVEGLPGQRLTLHGRLDVRAAADVRLALADAVRSGSGDLLLDLSGVVAVDATGLGVLVGAHREAGRAGRTLVLLDVPERVGRLLFVTRLHRVLRTSRTAAEA